MNNLSLILSISISQCIAIFIFLNTNFIIEYYNLFKIKGLYWLDEYNKYNQDGYTCSFSEFLIRQYDTFFTRLLTCAICLSVWGGLLSIPLIGLNFLIVTFFTLIFYFLLKILYNLSK